MGRRQEKSVLRRAIPIALAVAFGAGLYLAYRQWNGTDGDSARSPSVPPLNTPDTGERPPGSLVLSPLLAPESRPLSAGPGPILSDELPLASAARADGGVAAEKADLAQPRPSTSPPAVPAPPASDPAPVRPAIAADVENSVRLARAAFSAGDKTRGVKLLREAFLAGKDRDDLDLTAEARELFEFDEEDKTAPKSADDAARTEVLRYLAVREKDPTLRFRALVALGGLEAKSEKAETLRAAWEHLSDAYLAASGTPARRQVLGVLDPFLKKHVFSKRFSPLLSTHTVKSGESLNRIAKSRGTTEEAIQRLNQMRGEVIHPGQRLLVLDGKPRIVVKKSEFRLYLLVGGRLLHEARVGLGRDSSTPVTKFVIKDRQKDPIWYRRGEPPIPAGDARNILGTRWLGFKNTQDLEGFGIHGTSDPSSIGKEESSGCIRMLTPDLELVWDFVPAGTEVEVE